MTPTTSWVPTDIDTSLSASSPPNPTLTWSTTKTAPMSSPPVAAPPSAGCGEAWTIGPTPTGPPYPIGS